MMLCERTLHCKSTREKVWYFLTDTNRLNWSVGMGRLALMPLNDASAGRYLAQTKLGGFSMVFEEQPYEWVFMQRFQVHRPVRQGPIQAIDMSFQLHDGRQGGTSVTLSLAMQPRSQLLIPVCFLRGNMSLRDFAKQLYRFDSLTGTSASRSRQHIGDESLMRAGLLSLSRTEPLDLVDRINDLIRYGDSLQVGRLKPYQLADNWAVNRQVVLWLCLQSVAVGLLEQRWEVICPSCRTATYAVNSLGELASHATCQLCDIRFVADTKDALEVVFRPSPSLRVVEDGVFCIGGPGLTPHVLAQTILTAHGQQTLICPESVGQYRLFVRGGMAVPMTVSAEGRASMSIDVPAVNQLAPLKLSPNARLTLRNGTTRSFHAKIERREWVRQAATARDVELLYEARGSA